MNAERFQAGDYVENIHPVNRGRYPAGVVLSLDPCGIDNVEGQMVVRVGKGSTVYGPARNWQKTETQPDWLERVAYLEGTAELERHAQYER